MRLTDVVRAIIGARLMEHTLLMLAIAIGILKIVDYTFQYGQEISLLGDKNAYYV